MKDSVRRCLRLLAPAVICATLAAGLVLGQETATTKVKEKAKAAQLTTKERAALIQRIMKAFADKAAKDGVTKENVAKKKEDLKKDDARKQAPATTVAAVPGPGVLLGDCAICAACGAEAFLTCAAVGGPEDPVCEAAIVAISSEEPWCSVSCYACFL